MIAISYLLGLITLYQMPQGGAVVFACYAPQGQDPWLYSLLYNLSYMVPETLVNLVVLALFYPHLQEKLLEFRKDKLSHGKR